jgi:hypothetical protein
MTRLNFLLKTFATNTEQMRGMLDTQQTIVDTLGEKKEWVWLTDEEMESVYRSIYGAGTEHENLVEMGRATEAKLRGKNGY